MVEMEKNSFVEKWATRLNRKPEKLAEQLEKIDLAQDSVTDVAQALGIPEKKANYMKRAYKRTGMSYKRLDGLIPSIPMPAVMKMYRMYKKLLSKEAMFESELVSIRKELEKFKPIAHAMKSMEEASKKIKDELEVAETANK